MYYGSVVYVLDRGGHTRRVEGGGALVQVVALTEHGVQLAARDIFQQQKDRLHVLKRRCEGNDEGMRAPEEGLALCQCAVYLLDLGQPPLA